LKKKKKKKKGKSETLLGNDIFPMISYLDVILTGGPAISRYICAKYKPELTGSTPEEIGRATIFEGIFSDLSSSLDEIGAAETILLSKKRQECMKEALGKSKWRKEEVCFFLMLFRTVPRIFERRVSCGCPGEFRGFCFVRIAGKSSGGAHFRREIL
jgi:hypothetical protein